MKNRMSDLNNHLFAALERLSDDSLSDEQIGTEAKRADAIVSVADKIIGNATLQLNAAKLWAEHGSAILPMLPKIGTGEQ